MTVEISTEGEILEEFIKTIKSSNLFEGISAEEIAAMLVCLEAKVKKFKKGEFVVREGDVANSIGLILEGSSLIIQEDKWGNRNILEKVKVAQTFGTAFACVGGATLNVSVVADDDVQVLFLDIHRIVTVCSSACSHHNKIVRNLIAELAEKNLRLREKITHMNKRTTRDKIMSYLSAQSSKAGTREFEIPFSRQQMADYLGVERSGLSLELGKMKREGLIEFNKSHFVII